ncbi:MAG: M20/M25/M40 family metallo-hydrolase [Opitutus sp.]|nr:M20/M25/M40 family metallo-hydrolase [Opitutus sp.]
MNNPLKTLLLAVALGLLPLTAATAPDLDVVQREILATLKDFIRIPTFHPPGGETKAANFFQGILAQEGIASEILEKVPGRGNLVARIKGNGKKRPIILMGHLDTVGVEREKWTMDPFAAVEKDGYLYGRGTTDDKTSATVFLEVIRQLHRLKVPLDRDVIFVAEAAEETSAALGIEFLVAQHWDKIAAEFALNEGGITLEEDGRVKYVAVSAAEKVPRRLLLSATGVSGHGSRPRPDNAIVHLATAVAKLGAWQPPLRFNEITRPYFQRLAQISAPGDAWLYTHLDDPVVGAQAQEIVRRTQFLHNSMLRTSISPTVFNGGFQMNVIPSNALATLDIRALPDEDMPTFVAAMRQVIDDPTVEIVSVGGAQRPATPPSPITSEMFRAIERAQQKVFPGAITLPQMDAFATDSAQLREKGVQAYGLSPVTSAEDNARMHGNDERIKIATLKSFFELVWTAVLDVAEANP